MKGIPALVLWWLLSSAWGIVCVTQPGVTALGAIIVEVAITVMVIFIWYVFSGGHDR